MKNKLTRKLMLSAFTLLFAVISLGASTYAWFTMSEYSKINAFDANVKAGQGIEIAVTSTKDLGDAQWYVGQVPTGVIKEVAVGQNFEFDAVTPQLNDNKFTYDNEKFLDYSNSEKTGYISFFVHVKSAQSGDLNLDSINLTTTADKAWASSVSFIPAASDTPVEVGEKIKYKVEDAARVALVLADNTTKIYQKDAASYTAATAQDAAYSGNTTDWITTKGAYEYYDKINPENKLEDEDGQVASYTASLINETLGLEEDDLYEKLFDINAYDVATETNENTNIVTFQVIVWVEGWDAECLNAIFAQNLSVTLSFYLKSDGE